MWETKTTSFYQQLETVFEAFLAGETPLVLGDLNAVVGSLRAGSEAVVGPHGNDIRTGNGSKLLDFFSGHSLTVAGISDQITIDGPGIPTRPLACLRSIMSLWLLTP